MGGVYRPYARVRVVVGVHTEAKRFVVPQRRRTPVTTVVTETIHSFGQTLLLHFGLSVPFPFLLLLTLFLQFTASITSQIWFNGCTVEERERVQ